MLQYFGKNSPVSMEVIYGPKIINVKIRLVNMRRKKNTSKCKWWNTSHIPYFCMNVWITEAHFDRAMIFLEDLSRTGDLN